MRAYFRPLAGIARIAPSVLAALGLLVLVSCSGGGGGDAPAGGGGGGGSGSGGGGGGGGTPVTGAFSTPEGTARFLTQATFGPTPEEINALTGTQVEDWFLAELAKPASLNLPYVLQRLSEPGVGGPFDRQFEYSRLPSETFWRNAVSADDQLRQRMAFALSQIFVVSNENDILNAFAEMVAYFQDILTRNAFGNYRDILEEVTYSPAMGEYLTYLQNQRGDPVTGRTPDENYAREVMQLFTIGLVMLELDGDPIIGGDGQPVETYTNDDVTGLAKVFTGLSLAGSQFFYGDSDLEPDALYTPMQAFPAFHSELEKTFLGTTIPANTGPEASIDAALDTLFNHPNLAPFVSRQLIQRFVMSAPPGAYIERVATAFESGSYQLPDGRSVGTGARGDLAATIAAVLFDEYARSDSLRGLNGYGKIREPVLRFANWARAFDASTVTPQHTFALYLTGFPTALFQQPYGSPSVFNFYRPGYIAPGTETGDAGLTMPELQLINASTVAGYANFMSYFIYARAAEEEVGEPAASFIPNYADELALADDPQALVDWLNLTLAYGSLSATTQADIVALLNEIPIATGDPNFDGATFRVQTAIFMVMTATDYLVQR